MTERTLFMRTPRLIGLALAGTAALVLGACADSATLEGKASSKAIVVGSQDYYSNEIIAEVYAQALEDAGYEVDRQFRIGQREVYMPELQAGSIDLLPEYTGNLLQHLDPSAKATSADDVIAALPGALPDGLRALDAAPASDQDSYVVTRAFAQEHSLRSIGDLAGIEGLILGGNSELETRPYGPTGLKDVYGVTVSFAPIEDSGGALTLKALRDGSVHLVDVYSADPALASEDLTVLEDPEGMFLSSRVVPLVSDAIDEGAATVINRVSAALDPDDLIGMNRRSTEEAASAAAIATAWLNSEGLLGK